MNFIRDVFIPHEIKLCDKEKLTKFIIIKNYFLICASMWAFFTSLTAIGGVQSTVNKEGGLGLASSCVAFSVAGLSSLVVPQVLINTIKFKWTYTMGLTLQLFYIGLNAYPKWYTYLPASALGGLGQALIFTCSGLGVRVLCQEYARVTKTDAAPGLFFGIYGIFLQAAGTTGNLFVALVFGNFNKNLNETMSNSSFDYSTCGASFCPQSLLPPSAEPKLSQVYTLVGVLGGCVVLSIIFSLFMNNIDYISNEKGVKIKNIVKKQLIELRIQLFQIEQLLVIPMTLMNGYVLTFIWVDFTRSFAACSVGIDFIGWGSIVLYVTAGVFSPIFGKIASRFSIKIVFIFYWMLTIATSVWMLLWKSNPHTLHNLFILAILLGLIESINTPIPRALYAIIFKTEAIYSSFCFFQGIGFLFGFLITTFLCTHVKIYILIALCITSCIGGVILACWRKSKHNEYEFK